jgi:hypothetical protein
MNTNEIGTYRVTIGGDEYTKRVMQIRGFLSTDYSVIKVRADGKRISSHLNSNVHRHAISRIESALAQKK